MQYVETRKAAVPKLVWWSLALAGGYAAAKAAQQIRVQIRNQHLRRGQRIVILGAGFGGRALALCLAKELPNDRDAEITLVDQDSYLLFTPMLTEAAGGELDPEHIVSSATHLPRRISYLQAQVQQIDLKEKRVKVRIGNTAHRIPEAERTLAADHLVLALGSISNFHQIPGLEEHCLTIKSVEDAVAIRQRMLGLLWRANEESNEQVRRELLTVVVGGAGYTGLETMAAINDLLRESARKYPKLRRREIRTVLIDPGERVLPELTEHLARYAQRELEIRGVEIRFNSKVTGAGPDFVELNGNERISTRTIIWAGGVKPNPLLETLPCQRSHHGAVMVDGFLAVPGFPGVWALGDGADVPQPDGKGSYAPTAQNAHQEGAVVARNIAATLRDEVLQRFEYRPVGELALVGRHAAVARIFGIPVWGLPAWLMWRVIYWTKMPSISQRFRILSDWAFDFVFGRDLALAPPASAPAQVAGNGAGTGGTGISPNQPTLIHPAKQS